MTDDTATDGVERPDEPLPFKAEYEIGVHPAGYPDDWDHYHPRAKTMERAKEKAKKEAKRDGMDAPMVYMASGPFKPRDPIRVGEEMVKEVFGDV